MTMTNIPAGVTNTGTGFLAYTHPNVSFGGQKKFTLTVRNDNTIVVGTTYGIESASLIIPLETLKYMVQKAEEETKKERLPEGVRFRDGRPNTRDYTIKDGDGDSLDATVSESGILIGRVDNSGAYLTKKTLEWMLKKLDEN